MMVDKHWGYEKRDDWHKIVVDYGGPNVAKPLHVGHLRAAIIGESLKRLARFLGYEAIGDVHLGDWGLQMGMIICELRARQPGLPYFDIANSAPYPTEPPLTVADLEEVYPVASQHAKDDPAFMEEARQATYDLQRGRVGYRALWKHFTTASVSDMKKDYEKIGVEFDLWLGESDVQERIPDLVARLLASGYAKKSRGAIIVDGIMDNGRELTPLVLVKSDGAALYATTDLATIEQRVEDLKPDLILYVVDGRQATHFCQVFQCCL